jgi:hypothetical protein
MPEAAVYSAASVMPPPGVVEAIPFNDRIFVNVKSFLSADQARALAADLISKADMQAPRSCSLGVIRQCARHRNGRIDLVIAGSFTLTGLDLLSRSIRSFASQFRRVQKASERLA